MGLQARKYLLSDFSRLRTLSLRKHGFLALPRPSASVGLRQKSGSLHL